jgi:hypothetical protein
MENLFLVAEDGNSHGPLIPIGIYNYETLCSRYSISRTEEELTMVYRWYDESDVGYEKYVLHIRPNRDIPSLRY